MTILFDSVVFDLDGTLIATDRFWVQAARTGARRAFQELGLEREVPGAAQWMDLVGKPLDDGFRELFADLSDDERRAVQAACVAEEHRLLRAGGAALMPGTLDVLRTLRAAGLRIAIASNCSQAYLDHMLGLGLAELVDAAFCLDSPGIGSKADMIREALERFGTRSALMVGDRAGDRDAAWANGLPHVHCAFGFAGREEAIAAEGIIEDLPELLELVAGRAAWIETSLERVGALRAPFLGGGGGGAPAVLGVTGAPLAGKGLFARDAARMLAARGVPARVVSLAAFARPAPAEGVAVDERPLEALYDVEQLEAELLEPHAAGASVRLGARGDVEAGAVLVLEGPFLNDPRLLPRLHRVLHLELDEERILLRAAARDGRERGALADLRGRILPAWRGFARRYDPRILSDLVVDASNPFGTRPLGAPRA